MNRRQMISILAILLMMTAACSQGPDTPELQKETRFLMDTYVTIQAPGDESVLRAIAAALDRMEAVDRKFNILEEGNVLYRFNHQNVPIEDDEILKVLDHALSVSEESRGAFDITVYPLIDLWGFFKKSPALPSREKLEALLAHVGSDRLLRDTGNLSKLDADTQIDLGGIAKGYAIQAGLDVLKAHGLSSALIDAGGDIYGLGTLNGQPWRIGIRNPRGEGIIGDVEVTDLAVVTSGDYERFFEADGIRYHHLLNPHTGFPARGLTSVTVMSSDPMKADAFATAIFILGREEGIALANRTDDLEAFVITDDGERIASSGL